MVDVVFITSKHYWAISNCKEYSIVFGGDWFCEIAHVFCDISPNSVRYHRKQVQFDWIQRKKNFITKRWQLIKFYEMFSGKCSIGEYFIEGLLFFCKIFSMSQNIIFDERSFQCFDQFLQPLETRAEWTPAPLLI